MKMLSLIFSGFLICIAASGCAGVFGEEACGLEVSPLEIEQTRLAPGDTVRLGGGPFYVGCNDTAIGILPPLPEPPDRDIRLTFRQGGERWDLGSAQAGRGDYRFTQEVEVPADVEAGHATIVASGENAEMRGGVRVLPLSGG